MTKRRHNKTKKQHGGGGGVSSMKKTIKDTVKETVKEIIGRKPELTFTDYTNPMIDNYHKGHAVGYTGVYGIRSSHKGGKKRGKHTRRNRR